MAGGDYLVCKKWNLRVWVTVILPLNYGLKNLFTCDQYEKKDARHPH